MRYVLTPVTALFFILVASDVFPQSSPEPAQTDSTKRIVSRAQARQSLQLARLAADNELFDLSLKAVRETFWKGPPFESVGVVPDPGSNIPTGTLTIGKTNPQTHDQIVVEVYQGVTKLVQIWQQKQVESSRIYETLRDVVFPPGRPQEVFLYAPPVRGANRTLPETMHLGRLLIEYAQRAGQLDDLEQHIQQRIEFPQAKVPSHVMSCELALLDSDESEIRQLLDNLTPVIREARNSSEREILNHFILRAIANPAVRDSAIPPYEQLIETYPPSTETENGRLEPISSLLISAARLRSRQGNLEKSREHIERFLAVNEANNRRFDGDQSFQMARGQLEQAAIVFLEANMVEDAIQKFGEAAALQAGVARSIPDQGHYLLARMLKLLQQSPAEKRYEVLLKMVIPESRHNEVVLLVDTVSDLKAPERFQAAIPESQTGQRLNLQGYGPAGLLISTGSMLVETAAEANRLEELMQKIKPRHQAGNANARILWGLCLIERDDQELIPMLEELAQVYREASAENLRFTDNDIWKDVLLISGALKVSAAQSQNLALINELSAYCQKLQRWPILARLRVIHAEAVAHTRQSAASRPFAAAKPQLWDSVSEVSAIEHIQGGGKSYWFEQEEHLQHIGGGHESGLYFRYPLTGEFRIEAHTYDSGWSESEVAYGGVVHKFQCWSASGEIYANGGNGRFKRTNLFTNRPDPGIFLKHSIAVSPDGAVHKVNGHPVHADPHFRLSPWIGFRAAPHCKTVVKRLKILGSPVIPREVRLSDSPLMRGWLTGFYNESRPPALYANNDLAEQTILTQAAGTNWDWRWEEQEMIGRKTVSRQPVSSATESRIYFERPLFSGDFVDWEFAYKPGEELVHPALGRLTFLLRPAGVKLHWMTDGPQDPNGLPTDHELDDPQGRRGPDPLPLQVGWNRMQLALDGDQVRLTLNGVTVYERVFDDLDDKGFGFFHFKDRTTARVRNVVLSGDWPESLTPELRKAFESPASKPIEPSARYALAETIGQHVFQFDTLNRYLDALDRPDEERYQFLQQWVIPEPVHPFWRVDAAFTPTMMPPQLQEEFSRITQLSPAQQQLNPAVGGILVSPAVELVATARRLNRLDELRQRVSSQYASPGSTVSVRAKQVLLLLCDLAEENYAQVNQALQDLETTFPEVKSQAAADRWPSVVAASQAMLYDQTRLRATSLLKHIVTEQNRTEQQDNWTWNDRIAALWGLAKFLSATGTNANAYGSPPDLDHWIPAVHTHGDHLEYGVPWPQWVRIDNAVHHLVGHSRDCLYFQSPLLGDFTVEAYATSPGHRDTILQYGDRWVNPTFRKDKFDHGTTGADVGSGYISPAPEIASDGYHLKIDVQNNRGTVFINNRQAHEFEYDPVRDPWLAVWSRNRNHGHIRDLKISGSPRIPDELLLSGNPTPAGWIATYFRQPMDGNFPDWYQRDDEIVGRFRPDREGLFEESLLQYHRPLPSECELSYEFRYDPQAQEVHPAVGRLVFLLKPDGVYTHWLTNGRFNQYGLDADHSRREAESQKHQGQLPLKAGAQNRMKLTLQGDRLQLILNGELVFERQLTDRDSRLFGFFHYKGQSEASVKNVTLKGNWPKTLPAPAEQQLAASQLENRDSYAERFTSRFAIDFGKEKPAPEKFRIANPQLVQTVPEGLKFTSPGKGSWSEINMLARCQLKGDFDVAMSFENLSFDMPGKGLHSVAALFIAWPASKEGVRNGFQIYNDQERVLLSNYSYPDLDGETVYLSSRESFPGNSGTYRIVRQGNVVTCLFAPGGSNQFRKLSTRIIHDQEVPAGGLRVRAVAGQEGTETSFIVTSLKIAADEIIWPE